MTQKLMLVLTICMVLSSCTDGAPKSGTTAGPAESAAGMESVKDKDSGTIVAERAVARWTALIDADVDAAYEFLTPAHRKVMLLENYQVNLNPGMRREIRVESTSCDPLVRVCEVVLFLKYDLKAVKGIEMKKKESWVEESGNWWYVPKS